MSIHQIMLTTDFSDNGRRAYPCAASLAREFNAVLHLVNAQTPVAFQWNQAAEMIDEVESHLKRELAEQAVFDGLDTKTAVVSHRWPHKGLEEYAQQMGIDLIVTATHGWSPVQRFLLGSFAERLARNARRPVLVSRGQQDAPGSFMPREVLVPYDFSPISAAILPMVRLLSQHYHCRFTFLYVYGCMSGNAPFIVRLLKNWEHDELHVERRFGELREQELAGVNVRLETSQGVPYEEILRRATGIRADLVLLATHGLLGAVAQNVLRSADCSVLTVFAESSDADW